MSTTVRDVFETKLIEVLESYGVIEDVSLEVVSRGDFDENIYHVTTPSWSIERENIIYKEVCKQMMDFCQENNMGEFYNFSYILFD